MKFTLSLAILVLSVLSMAQAHVAAPPDVTPLDFIVGDWKGKQVFNAELAGREMTADVELHVGKIGRGRYVEEQIKTTLEGKVSEVRHLTSLDKDGKPQTWWFNDTSGTPSHMLGTVEGTKVVFVTKRPEGSQAPLLRATFENRGKNEFGFWVEMQQGEAWVKLFDTTYKRTA